MKEAFESKIAAYAKGDIDDQVSLFQIVDCIERAFNVSDEAQLRKLTDDFIKSALSAGFKAGEFSKEDYVFRVFDDQTPERISSLIAKEWDAIGRKPTLGEIVWFGLPGYEYPVK